MSNEVSLVDLINQRNHLRKEYDRTGDYSFKEQVILLEMSIGRSVEFNHLAQPSYDITVKV